MSVGALGTEFVIVFRLFRGAGAETALVVGESANSSSAAVAFCFPLLLLDIVEAGGGSGKTPNVRRGCGVPALLINSENWLWARRVLRERPSSTEDSIIRSCSALNYSKYKQGYLSFKEGYPGSQQTYLEEVFGVVVSCNL